MRYLGLIVALCVASPVLAQPFVDIGAGLEAVKLSSVAWGDYDNDGDLDILLTGWDPSAISTSRIYRNDFSIFTGFEFTDIGANLAEVKDSSVAWGDYDNDGDLDILLTGSGTGGTVSLVYRNDSGIFTDIGAGLVEAWVSSVAWGDYDNDGDLDILRTGWDSSLNSISLIYRNDAGTFTDIGAGLEGVQSSSVAWGDYDNDGDLDILLTGFGSSRVSLVYRNDAGLFTDIGASLEGVNSPSVAWGDYDNDGDLDILLTGSSDSDVVSIIYRNDAGTFTDIGAGLEGVWRPSVAWGDYDNDGDLDILLSGQNSSFLPVSLIYRNDAGTFTDIGAGLKNVSKSSVAWGDYDNDGDLDILLTGDDSTNSNNSLIYRNDVGSTNLPPVAPDIIGGTVVSGQLSISWKAPSDDNTPKLGVNYNLQMGATPTDQTVISGMADAANGYRRIPAIGNTGSGLSHPLPLETLFIPSRPQHYASVQAIDTAFAGSPMSTVIGPLLSPLNLSVEDIPNDQGRQVRVEWDRTPLDSPEAQLSIPITEYAVWRRIDLQMKSAMGPLPEGAAQAAAQMITQAATWEFVGSTPAWGQPSYALVVPTLCDSTDAGICISEFLVTARTSNPFLYVESNPDSGYSVDNLSPSVPINLVATYNQAVQLSWTGIGDEDFRYYRVYRSNTSGFVPDETNHLGDSITADLVDNTAIAGLAYYYVVTATDFAGNESGASNQVGVDLTVVGVETLPDAFGLQQNFPNPFNPSTTIAFDLPAAAEVELRIHDARGRLVRTLATKPFEAGRHSLVWDGRDDRGATLPSGAYLLELKAGEHRQVQRMTLLK